MSDETRSTDPAAVLCAIAKWGHYDDWQAAARSIQLKLAENARQIADMMHEQPVGAPDSDAVRYEDALACHGAVDLLRSVLGVPRAMRPIDVAHEIMDRLGRAKIAMAAARVTAIRLDAVRALASHGCTCRPAGLQCPACRIAEAVK